MKIHEASKILILGLIVGCHALLSLYKEKLSLRLVAMAVKFLDLRKPCSCKYGRKFKRTKKKMTFMTFSYSIALRNKTVANTFLPSSNNANGRLSQEVMLRSRNFATMVT